MRLPGGKKTEKGEFRQWNLKAERPLSGGISGSGGHYGDHFCTKGVFPFGDESFLRTDMYHQYAPFFAEFRHKLADGGSLLYSWNVGMGVNFAALYAYYPGQVP